MQYFEKLYRKLRFNLCAPSMSVLVFSKHYEACKGEMDLKEIILKKLDKVLTGYDYHKLIEYFQTFPDDIKTDLTFLEKIFFFANFKYGGGESKGVFEVYNLLPEKAKEDDEIIKFAMDRCSVGQMPSIYSDYIRTSSEHCLDVTLKFVDRIAFQKGAYQMYVNLIPESHRTDFNVLNIMLSSPLEVALAVYENHVSSVLKNDIGFIKKVFLDCIGETSYEIYRRNSCEEIRHNKEIVIIVIKKQDINKAVELYNSYLNEDLKNDKDVMLALLDCCNSENYIDIFKENILGKTVMDLEFVVMILTRLRYLCVKWIRYMSYFETYDMYDANRAYSSFAKGKFIEIFNSLSDDLKAENNVLYCCSISCGDSDIQFFIDQIKLDETNREYFVKRLQSEIPVIEKEYNDSKNAHYSTALEVNSNTVLGETHTVYSYSTGKDYFKTEFQYKRLLEVQRFMQSHQENL